MKYWNELNSLENALYDFEKIGASLNILIKSEDMISAPSNIPQEYQTFLQDVNDRMIDAVENVRQKFQDVWDSVREDSSEKRSSVAPPWEEDILAIDELVKEQSDTNRWKNIVNDLIDWNELNSQVKES